jgi:hypothetical protein
VTLLVTFGTRENYHTEHLHFEVMQPDHTMKAILLRENDPDKTTLIGADLDQA